jgi:hypothetical protein
MLAVIKNNEKKLWILLKTKKNHYKQYFVYKSIEVQKKWKLKTCKEKQTFQNSAD